MYLRPTPSNQSKGSEKNKKEIVCILLIFEDYLFVIWFNWVKGSLLPLIEVYYSVENDDDSFSLDLSDL